MADKAVKAPAAPGTEAEAVAATASPPQEAKRTRLVFLKQHYKDGRTYRPARTEVNRFGKTIQHPADSEWFSDPREIRALVSKGIALREQDYEGAAV